MKNHNFICRLYSYFRKYHVYLLPTKSSADENKKLLRNIKALGYNCVKITGQYETSFTTKTFYAVLSSTNSKISFDNLAVNMTKLSQKYGIDSGFSFKVGTLKRNDNKFILGDISYIPETVSDIIDHKITTASMYNAYLNTV